MGARIVIWRSGPSYNCPTTATPGSAGILASVNRRKPEENYAGKDAGAPRFGTSSS